MHWRQRVVDHFCLYTSTWIIILLIILQVSWWHSLALSLAWLWWVPSTFLSNRTCCLAWRWALSNIISVHETTCKLLLLARQHRNCSETKMDWLKSSCCIKVIAEGDQYARSAYLVRNLRECAGILFHSSTSHFLPTSCFFSLLLIQPYLLKNLTFWRDCELRQSVILPCACYLVIFGKKVHPLQVISSTYFWISAWNFTTCIHAMHFICCPKNEC